MKKEKLVTVEINGSQRRFPESQIPKVIAHMEKLKKEALEKGASREFVDRVWTVKIAKEEE